MAVTIDIHKNIALKVGDAVLLSISTVGLIKAVVGDEATFMVKQAIDDADVDAIITKATTVTTENTVEITVDSTETEVLVPETYYWSVKQVTTLDGNSYTIVPDSGKEPYPTFKVGGALINA